MTGRNTGGPAASAEQSAPDESAPDQARPGRRKETALAGAGAFGAERWPVACWLLHPAS